MLHDSKTTYVDVCFILCFCCLRNGKKKEAIFEIWNYKHSLVILIVQIDVSSCSVLKFSLLLTFDVLIHLCLCVTIDKKNYEKREWNLLIEFFHLDSFLSLSTIKSKGGKAEILIADDLKWLSLIVNDFHWLPLTINSTVAIRQWFKALVSISIEKMFNHFYSVSDWSIFDQSDFEIVFDDDWSDGSYHIRMDMADNLWTAISSTRKLIFLITLQRLKIWLIENGPIGDWSDVVLYILFCI